MLDPFELAVEYFKDQLGLSEEEATNEVEALDEDELSALADELEGE